MDSEILPPYLPEKKLKANVSVWIQENGKKIILGGGNMSPSIQNKYRKN